MTCAICFSSTPDGFGLCEYHYARWLVSLERVRRDRMRLLEYPEYAIRGAFMDFVVATSKMGEQK